MAVGLLIMGVGALIFIPAALTRIYPLFLTGLFVQGTGLAVLQTASNPYITILGSIESAAKRISIMGICNKIAGGIAPIILGAMILKDADGIKARLLTMTNIDKQAELDLLGHRVILPYIIILIALVILAIVIYYSPLPEIDTNKDDTAKEGDSSKAESVFQYPNLVLGVITLFLYVGVEVLAGDSIISYGASQGIPLSTAKFFTTCTLMGMIAGYIVGITCIPKYFSQANALKVSAIIGAIFSVVAVFASSHTSILFIALLGLANSLMWPAIWPLAINGLGKFTKIGSSLLIMGIAGGALIPLLYGRLSDIFSPQKAYWILVPCYLFIWYYAARGHKIKSKSKNYNS
jgi:FHS family L-fucose permease-like MFS transporter